MNNEEYIAEIKGIKTKSIIGIICFLTLIGAIVTFVLSIVNAIKILTFNWIKETEKDKVLWGLLTLIVLGPIASLVFAEKAKTDFDKHLENQNNNNTTNVNNEKKSIIKLENK